MDYFSEGFSCPCCGKDWIAEGFKKKLNKARGISGCSYVINSGCRCGKHNKAVGGTRTSSHLTGLAVDIKVKNSTSRYAIIKGLISAGFKRIGIAKTFIHADDDKNKTAKVAWTY